MGWVFETNGGKISHQIAQEIWDKFLKGIITGILHKTAGINLWNINGKTFREISKKIFKIAFGRIPDHFFGFFKGNKLPK